MEALTSWLSGLPEWLLYLVLAAGSGVENFFPPIPADTFVVFGAFLAGRGYADAWLVLASCWAANVLTALATYGLARRYGRGWFETRFGKWLLRPGQLDRIDRFYDRWGTPAIFFSRFFPALRALVPIFGGISGLGFLRVAPALASASLIWYAPLVYLGAVTGRKWEELRSIVEAAGSWLAWVAAALVLAFAAWWWRTRR